MPLKMLRSSALRRGWIAVALGTSCVAAWSQQPAPLPSVPGAPAELPRARAQGAPTQDPFLLPPVVLPPVPAADDDAPFVRTLRRVAFEGNSAVTTADLQAVAAPFLGRAQSAADIEQLRLRLTRLYIERGFINSGVVLRRRGDDQESVVFDVVEGRLSEIRLHGLDGLQSAYVTEQLQRPGDGPLNIDVLRERFQLLLTDPLFERLNARLLPGTQPGDAVLDIEVTRGPPSQFTVFANNYLPVPLGAAQAGVNGWIRNLSGRGDVLDLALQAPFSRAGDLRGSLGWRMPLNHRGTQLVAGIDRGDATVLDESVRTLDIRSRLSSLELGLSQVVSETLAHKLQAGISALRRKNRTTLLGEPFSFIPGEPTGTTHERSWRFWQELALRSEDQVLAVRSTFTRGRNNVGDAPPAEGADPEALVPARFGVWLGQGHYAARVARNGAQFIARGVVQRSPDRLLAINGLALGGIGTVRGFRENQLVRDQGAVLNLELEWPLLRRGEDAIGLWITPFHDWGRGRNHGESASTLSSAGVAFRLEWQGVRVDLAIAKRLRSPALAQDRGANLQDKGVHLQVAYQH